MDAFERQLARYHELTPRERLLLEAYVEAFPEEASMLEAITADIPVSGDDGDPPMPSGQHPNAAALAYFVATTSMSQPLPRALQAAFASLEEQVRQDPSLREQVAVLKERMQALSSSQEAVSQFEELTGYSVLDIPVQHSTPSVEAPAPLRLATPRAAAPPPGRIRRLTARWAVAASVMLLGMSALWALSQQSQSPLQRMAVVDVSMIQNDQVGLVSRGSTDLAALYDRALSQIIEARSSWLGFFPEYAPGTLQSAAGLLEQVIREANQDDELQTRAYYYLGNIRLLLNDAQQARAALAVVADRGGWKAAEAAAMLARM